MIRRCFYKIFVFSLFFVLINAVLFFTVPRPHDHYLRMNIDKRASLRSTPSPKIILVGGSNVPFGFNSRMIEGALHRPVVNMGLSAPLGLRFMLSEVLPEIHQGDLVIVSPEYEQAFDQMLEGDADLAQLIILNPRAACFLTSFRQRLVFFQYYGVAMGRVIMASLEKKRDDVYRRSIFDSKGDAIGHLSLPSTYDPTDAWQFPSWDKFNRNYILALNNFYKDVWNKGAKAFFVFPGIPLNVYQNNAEPLPAFYQFLQTRLSMPILASPKQYVFPNEYIYNNMYHFNKVGIKARTERLIADLNRYEKGHAFGKNGRLK